MSTQVQATSICGRCHLQSIVRWKPWRATDAQPNSKRHRTAQAQCWHLTEISFGQRRVDDPSVSTPAGLGSNVFKDRGATDRADFAALQAVLLQPQDNDSANVDVDRTISYVRLESGLLDYFSILLSDGEGIGPDASTVQPRQCV